MRQAIHIFRKDVRHCWPYIAAVLALIAVNAGQASFCVTDPTKTPATVSYLLNPLMTLAWWLAIGAAIHGESLVGDRQFWTTRPYSWKSLLAAKSLFLAAFLGLPLFLSDCVILLASGFNPLTVMPGLLWRQCWFLAFIATAIVVAALTRRTGELVLVLVLSWAVVLVAWFVSATHYANPSPAHLVMPLWIGDTVPWLVCVAGLFLVVWQYASRRTFLIRVVAILLFGWTPVWAPWWMITRMQMTSSVTVPREYRYREDPKYRNVTVELAADPGSAGSVTVDRRTEGRIGIPVKFSGWPRDMMSCQLRSVAASSTVPKAYGRWATSVSYPEFSTTGAGGGREWISLSIGDLARQTLLWRTAGTVELEVSFELKLYRIQKSVDLQPGRGWTYVSGFGNVRMLKDAGGGHLIWRTALEPGEKEWNYSFGDARSKSFTEAGCTGSSNYQPLSPDSFPISPVYSYAGCVTVPAPVPHSLRFTARPLVATLVRSVKIPGFGLTGYPTDNH
ncbi:MAG: hypothetical protein ABSE42_21205 [Bryobacteraceae bacterium]|jgi:hypothetical protein